MYNNKIITLNNLEYFYRKLQDKLSNRKQINQGVSNTTCTIKPNIFYIWDVVENLELDLFEPENGDNILNEYLFQFESGNNATKVTILDDIRWNNIDDELIIEPNKVYRISIFNNFGNVICWDNFAYFKKKHLTFEVLEDGTFSFSTNNIDYSLDDGSTWTTLTVGSSTPTISAGSKVMWRATLSPNGANGIGTFSSTGKFNVEGNIMSLLYGDDFEGKVDLTDKNYAFYTLFENCNNLIDAQNLILPATTLADSCYASMFYSCTSLTTAPELPATTLATYCYRQMFDSCTSLTKAPSVLPATTLAHGCYQSMFERCKLISAPELPATTLTEACYRGMFQKCNELISAPELPATSLTELCYQSMFDGCSKLNNITMLATNISANKCLTDWVNDVASTGTFTKHKDMTTLSTGTSGIPEGWTVNDYVEPVS